MRHFPFFIAGFGKGSRSGFSRRIVARRWSCRSDNPVGVAVAEGAGPLRVYGVPWFGVRRRDGVGAHERCGDVIDWASVSAFGMLIIVGAGMRRLPGLGGPSVNGLAG